MNIKQLQYFVTIVENGTITAAAKKLGISARQLSYVKQSDAGEGLLLYGDTILPFVDRFPQDTELYRLMTTRLNETAGQEEENG